MVATQGPAASDIGRVPGWYGKLPSLGDFASRRLEGDFIEPWDLWLGERLQALRDARGDAWLQPYLHSPPWRFLLTPGTLPAFDRSSTLAGVLLPSVDRVGRYFPVTLVAALPLVPNTARAFAALLGWMQRLEDTALDAVQHEWDIDALERALVALAPPGGDASERNDDPLAAARGELAAALAARGGLVELAPAVARQDIAAVIAGAMDPATVTSRPAPGLNSSLRGVGLWLADRPDRQRVLVSEGLPASRDFFLMFGDGQTPVEIVSPPIPDDADLLGMFEIAPAAAPSSRAPDAPGTDVLGLFSAPVVPATPDHGDARPGDADILALFDALPSAHSPLGEEKKSSEPDILDLFGVKPTDDGKPI